MDQLKIVFIVGTLFCITLISFVTLAWIDVNSDINRAFQNIDFCKENGFYTYVEGKGYSEKFGKITCIVTYGNETITKEFEVQETPMGYLTEKAPISKVDKWVIDTFGSDE